MGYRYIGAKTRALPHILDKICSLVPQGGRVVDLMCGTGAVSAALRESGFRVTANDVMTFPFHHARIALLFTSPPEFLNAREFTHEYSGSTQKKMFPSTLYKRVLEALNNVPPKEDYFWREFSVEGEPANGQKPRNYFTPENAKKIDSVRGWISRLRECEYINALEQSLLLHDLIMAANDVANIAGTYGHYLSKTVERARYPLVLKPTSIVIRDDNGWHSVFRGYAEALADNLSCDLCYIDPPYMKRQYAANYHILETLARGDSPPAIGVSGLRPWRDQYSNFCTKTKIRKSFSEIFTKMDCSDFLISYSEDGLLTAGQLDSLFSEFGDVELLTFKYKRFRSNNSPLGPVLTEYLFHLRINRCPFLNPTLSADVS